jgi:phage terminase small subunit
MSNEQLSTKQRKFALAVAEGESLTSAAVSAGYAEASAHVQGSRLLRNDKVRRAITEVLEEKGLDDGYFSEKLRELCEASGEKGPEWGARGRGVELLGKVRGHLDAKLRVTHEEVPRNREEQAAQLLAIIHEIVPQLAKGEAPKVIEATGREVISSLPESVDMAVDRAIGGNSGDISYNP